MYNAVSKFFGVEVGVFESESHLKKELIKAKQHGYAVGAFNVFNYSSAKAVLDASENLKAPVILQTSVAVAKHYTPSRLMEMLNFSRLGMSKSVCVHLDHCTDVDFAKRCIDCGWDSVMIDLSRLSFDENLAGTNEVLEYARQAGDRICVESELGVIAGVEDDINSEIEIQSGYDEAIKFLNAADVDAFAPAIGTAHGFYTKEVDINYQLVRKLSANTDVPIVVHGGTGLTPEQFSQLIECGASKINVSTALKKAYFDATKSFFEKAQNSYNPIELDRSVNESMKNIVEEHIRWFGAEGKENE